MDIKLTQSFHWIVSLYIYIEKGFFFWKKIFFQGFFSINVNAACFEIGLWQKNISSSKNICFEAIQNGGKSVQTFLQMG